MQKSKTQIFILFFLFSSLIESAYCQDNTKDKSVQKTDKLKWYSFEEAFQLNKKKPKKVLVDIYTDWCGWCKKMDAETFTNPTIVDYLAKNYYCVKLNAERKDTIIIDGVTFVNPNPEGKRSTHQLAVDLLKGQMSYPSYVFLNEKSEWLTVVPGYHPAKEFEPILHYFGDNAYVKTAWGDFQSSFAGEIK
jgi:thioredoxin-related protein